MTRKIALELLPETTYSGSGFDIFNPSSDDINFVDLALGSAQSSKYTGGTEFYYSNAQAITIGSHIAEMEFGTEVAKIYIAANLWRGYIGPVSHRIAEFNNVQQIIAAVTREIMRFLGLDGTLSLDLLDKLQKVDDMMARVESAWLFEDIPAQSQPYVDEVQIAPQSPSQAVTCLIRRMKELFPALN